MVLYPIDRDKAAISIQLELATSVAALILGKDALHD